MGIMKDWERRCMVNNLGDSGALKTMKKLKRLKELLDMGAITEEEFEERKSILMEML